MFGIELLAVLVFGAPMGSVSAPIFETTDTGTHYVDPNNANYVESRTVGGYAAGIRVVLPTVPFSINQAPCATEDSINCTWDGRTRNNGIGATFVDVNGVQIFLTGRIND